MDLSRIDLVEIDWNRGIERFLGDRALYEMALTSYLEDHTVQDMQASFAVGDYQQMFFGAHTMKGAVSNLDMTVLCRTAAQLAEYLRNNSAPDPCQVEALLQAVTVADADARDAISRAL